MSDEEVTLQAESELEYESVFAELVDALLVSVALKHLDKEYLGLSTILTSAQMSVVFEIIIKEETVLRSAIEEALIALINAKAKLP